MMKQAGRRLGHVKQLVGTEGGGQSISKDRAVLLVVEDVVDGEREWEEGRLKPRLCLRVRVSRGRV
jgi:hypothetical protein